MAKTYSKKVTGEIHDLMRKKGPRFTVEDDVKKRTPRQQKYKRSNTVYKCW